MVKNESKHAADFTIKMVQFITPKSMYFVGLETVNYDTFIQNLVTFYVCCENSEILKERITNAIQRRVFQNNEFRNV